MDRNLLVELLNLHRRIFPFLFLSQGREKVIQFKGAESWLTEDTTRGCLSTTIATRNEK